jgi:hypothetical protein
MRTDLFFNLLEGFMALGKESVILKILKCKDCGAELLPYYEKGGYQILRTMDGRRHFKSYCNLNRLGQNNDG